MKAQDLGMLQPNSEERQDDESSGAEDKIVVPLDLKERSDSESESEEEEEEAEEDETRDLS